MSVWFVAESQNPVPGTWEAFTKYLCNEYKWDEVGKGQNEKHNGTETECVWV